MDTEKDPGSFLDPSRDTFTCLYGGLCEVHEQVEDDYDADHKSAEEDQSQYRARKSSNVDSRSPSFSIPVGVVIFALVFIPNPQFWPFLKMLSGVLLQPIACHFWCSRRCRT